MIGPVDLPRPFTIRESGHRIHNPLTSEKLATLGQAIGPAAGTAMLDLACGSGELLCTWARDHQVTGTGVDISTVFLASARAERPNWAWTARSRSFTTTPPATWPPPAGIAACVGATWIGGGVAGTVRLLRRSLAPGGMMLIGEPYWRREPPDQATAEACDGIGHDGWRSLPGLLESFGDLGCNVVEMVLADQDSWDRYAAAQWLNIRRWLDAHPDDELAPQMRAELDESPARYARYRREYLGWGVFVLMDRSTR